MKEQDNPDSIEALDREFVWHPFTQMRDWCDPAHTPTVIVSGSGCTLTDAAGRIYYDGNSSIWTNIHGHRHPTLDNAVRCQLDRIAHSSFLGLTNDSAPFLCRDLVVATAAPGQGYKVFLSDDGSTAIETGLKMMVQAREQRGEPGRKTLLSLSNGYHGDTVGAMSLGHSPLFHRTYRDLLFQTVEVPAPHCYRCPFNKAQPERGTEARACKRCSMECLTELEQRVVAAGDSLCGLVMEPIVQGAAGMWMHPQGYLARAAEIVRAHGGWLMLDEVMTGFGRTGSLFAFQKEQVAPDVLALGKGITGGYLPLAATLASAEIYDAFLGDYTELKTFFHGHSYSGNPLGCAVARASLGLFADGALLGGLGEKEAALVRVGDLFWQHPNVGDVRREGMILAIELVADFATREEYPWALRLGHRVSEVARNNGLITRPVGNVLVLMPPLCSRPSDIEAMGEALWKAVKQVVG